jgi:hypothetical protein
MLSTYDKPLSMYDKFFVISTTNFVVHYYKICRRTKFVVTTKTLYDKILLTTF